LAEKRCSFASERQILAVDGVDGESSLI